MPAESEYSKKYYRISDVAELTGLPISTLRYWESRFSIISPKRNSGGTRYYTPADIERIRLVNFLVKEKGLKLDAAIRQIKSNRDGLDRRSQAISRLREIRTVVEGMLKSLETVRK